MDDVVPIRSEDDWQYSRLCDKGKIGLDLPKASAKLNIYGVFREDTYYVTRLSINQIETEEEPFDFARDQSRAIGPIIDETMHRAQIKLDQRLIFNDVLRKFHTGIAWRKLAYEVGTWIGANKAYKKWLNNGTLDKALSSLAALHPTMI